MWTNRCTWVQSRLPLWAGGELVGTDRRRVERHLVGCRPCRKRLDAVQEALEALHTAATADPPVQANAASIWPSLARQIQESRRPYPAQSTWALAWPRLVLGSAAALVSGAMLLIWWIRPEPAPVRTVPLADAKPAAPVTTAPKEPPAPKALRAPAVRTASTRSRPASGGSGSSKETPAPSNESGAEGDRTGSSASDTRYTQ